MQLLSNSAAIKAWYTRAVRDAKLSRPSRRMDPTILEREGKWLTPKRMFAVAMQELNLGARPGRLLSSTAKLFRVAYLRCQHTCLLLLGER